MLLSTNAFAGSTDPLFVNLTTRDPYRAFMALTFSRHQTDKGSHVIIFLNDHGVFLASRKIPDDISANRILSAFVKPVRGEER